VAIHHEGADNDKKSSRHDRKNQPDNAYKNKNPTKSNRGLRWSGFCAFTILMSCLPDLPSSD
jgi:hypothetical protein